MPYNGSGVFVPALTLVGNTTAYAEDIDTLLTDVAAGLTQAMTRSGQAPATANLSMGGFQLQQVGPAQTTDAAVNLGQLQTGIPHSSNILYGPAGTVRSASWNTGTAASSAKRFEIQVNADAEAGSNAGSNIVVNAYADDGSTATVAFRITRATGQIDFPLAPTVAGGSIIPSGAVMGFAMRNAPAGWLFCNGSSLLRASYPTLFAAISTTYGLGADTITGTTFALPNLQGYFLRGFDAAGTIDPGRAFGSMQADQIQSFTGSVTLPTDGFTWQTPNSGGSSALRSESQTYGISFAGANFGSETRPKNIAMYYCIKT